MESRDSRIPTTMPLSYSYSPLLAAEAGSGEVSGTGRHTTLCAASLVHVVAALAGVCIIAPPRPMAAGVVAPEVVRSRSKDAGVSEKTSGVVSGVLGAEEEAGGNASPWSNAMLQWQRTGFPLPAAEELDDRRQRRHCT
ncbi:unnamed protein product [Urochloa humidicola]